MNYSTNEASQAVHSAIVLHMPKASRFYFRIQEAPRVPISVWRQFGNRKRSIIAKPVERFYSPAAPRCLLFADETASQHRGWFSEELVKFSSTGECGSWFYFALVSFVHLGSRESKSIGFACYPRRTHASDCERVPTSFPGTPIRSTEAFYFPGHSVLTPRAPCKLSCFDGEERDRGKNSSNNTLRVFLTVVYPTERKVKTMFIVTVTPGFAWARWMIGGR